MLSDLPTERNQKPDLSIARSLKWRYRIALVLVASLATAAWFSLRLVISEQESTAAVVNVSGRQRMLSQRTALFANLLVISPRTERPPIRSKLKEAIDLMARSHFGLTQGDAEMGLPASMSPAVSAMYFDGPNPLNTQVTTYIKTVNELLQLSDEALTPDNPLLQYITGTAPTTLVAALDRMVRQYQLEGEASIKGLEKAETTFWLLTLTLLMLEAGLIFQPFIKHMQVVIGKLRQVSEELQRHQNQLEETVENRTRELSSKTKELVDSEEKFRLISTTAQDAIAIIDADESVTYWNPAAEKIFGYAENEIAARNLHDLLAPVVYREAAHRGINSFRQSGQGQLIGRTFEITALRKDGAEFPIELSISSFQFHNKWHALGIMRDISERKAYEISLRNKEEQLRMVLDGAELGFWDWNIVTGTVDRNERWATMLGYSYEEIAHTTQQWADFVHPDDRDEAWQSINAVLDGQAKAHRLEYRMLHKDGSIRWILDQASVMQRDENGRPIRMSGTHSDITKRRQAQELLEQRERHLRAILDSTSECVKLVTRDGTVLAMNPAGLSLIEADTENDILGQSIYPILAPEYHQAFKAFNERICNGESGTLQYEIIGLKGARRWMETHAVPFRSKPGSELIQLAFTQEITERKHSEIKLQLAANVFTHAREGIVITDAYGSIIEVNDTFTHITGYSRDEIFGQNPRMLKSGRHGREFYAAMWQALLEKGHWSGEIWNRRKNGEVYPELITISAVRDADGVTQNYVALFTDITPIKAHQQQLEIFAHYDALTGLPNRVLLADRLQQAMSQSDRREQSLAVVYLDLDGFKTVNDAYGHQIGDELLIAVSQRMKDALREGDTLARIGGDEFIAVLVDLEQASHCEPILVRLLQAAAAPVTLGDVTARVSASLGVTFYPRDAVDADHLMRHADHAMYIAKQAGKNRYHLFDAD